MLYAKDGVISYKREKNEKRVIVVINKSKEEFEFEIKSPMKDFFTNKKREGSIVLQNNEFIVLTN